MKIQALVFTLLLVLHLNAAANAADVVLIVNKTNASTRIPEHEANNIFLGKKTTWSNGKKIVLVTQQNQQVHDSFAKQVLNKTAQQYALFWKKALFTGAGIPPKTVDNDAEVKAFVAGNKDAIGYISALALDGTVKKVDMN